MSWSLGRNPWATHLVECSGNHRNGHFGLISVAQWSGVPVSKVVAKLTIRRQATRVLISGLERYSQPRLDSLPQTSWIFSFEQLEATGAFFATGMNGSPLRKDHGYPIRLIVPGWYACTCIKWVDQIVLVDDTAAATHLMRDGQIRTLAAPMDLLFGNRSRSGGENFGPRLAYRPLPTLLPPRARSCRARYSDERRPSGATPVSLSRVSPWRWSC